MGKPPRSKLWHAPGRKIRANNVRRVSVDSAQLAHALALQLAALAHGTDPARVSVDAHNHSIPLEIDSASYVGRLRACKLNTDNGCGWAMLQLGPSPAETMLKRGFGAGQKQHVHVLVEFADAKLGGMATITRTYSRVTFTTTATATSETDTRTAQMHAIITEGWEPGDARLADL